MEDYEELASRLHSEVRAKKEEYIICAANWFNDGVVHEHQPKNIDIGFVVCGRRHHNCYVTMGILFKRMEDGIKGFSELDNTCVQGFLTSTDRFVDRKEGGEIAFKAGQTTELREILFSEDLY